MSSPILKFTVFGCIVILLNMKISVLGIVSSRLMSLRLLVMIYVELCVFAMAAGWLLQVTGSRVCGRRQRHLYVIYIKAEQQWSQDSVLRNLLVVLV